MCTKLQRGFTRRVAARHPRIARDRATAARPLPTCRALAPASTADRAELTPQPSGHAYLSAPPRTHHEVSPTRQSTIDQLRVHPPNASLPLLLTLSPCLLHGAVMRPAAHTAIEPRQLQVVGATRGCATRMIPRSPPRRGGLRMGSGSKRSRNRTPSPSFLGPAMPVPRPKADPSGSHRGLSGRDKRLLHQEHQLHAADH